MNKLALTLLAPALSVGLLAPMAAQDARRLRTEQAEGYHAKVKAAIEAIPEYIGDENVGTLVSEKRDVPPAAMKLLRPNIILSRSYTDVLNPGERADLLIVHCRDPRDMIGHYPPVCYPGSGNETKEVTPRDWTVRLPDGTARTIYGVEYVFEKQIRDTGLLGDAKAFTVVYNFLVVPDRRDTLRDMDALQRAAKDYQRRAFGAAQFQVVYFGTTARPVLARERRDALFSTLVGSAMPAIDAIVNASGDDSNGETGGAEASRAVEEKDRVKDQGDLKTVANGSLGTGLLRTGSTSH